MVGAGGTDDAIAVRVARGSLVPLRRSVYAIAGTSDTWLRTVMGCCLAAGSGAVAGGPTAAALWGLLKVPPTTLEIWVPSDRRVRRCDFTVRRVRDLTRSDVTTVDGVPCLSVTRTLIALASVVPVSVLEDCLDVALRRNLTNVVRLRKRIRELGTGGRRGLRVLAGMVEDRRGGVHDTELEKQFMAVLRKYKMPMPEYHPKVELDGHVYEPDFIYRAARVFIETDGMKGHSTRAELDEQDRRQNAFVKAGWRPMRFTWSDVTESGLQLCKDLAEAALLPWTPP
jgi:very-short-patch-repair endonuclease